MENFPVEGKSAVSRRDKKDKKLIRGISSILINALTVLGVEPSGSLYLHSENCEIS